MTMTMTMDMNANNHSLDELRNIQRNIKEIERHMEQLRVYRRLIMKVMAEEGWSLAKIGREVGISRQRVKMLIDDVEGVLPGAQDSMLDEIASAAARSEAKCGICNT